MRLREFVLLIFFVINQISSDDIKPSSQAMVMLDELKAAMTKLNGVFEKVHSRLAQKVITKQRTIHPGDHSGPNKTWVFMIGVGDRKYYMYQRPQLTYDQAFKWCKDRGLSLLSIETEAASTALEAAISTNDKTLYFTSGNDFSNLFHFIWKSSGKEFSVNNFFPGDPNNFNEQERCVTAGRKFGYNVGWFDSNCNEPREFICEKL